MTKVKLVLQNQHLIVSQDNWRWTNSFLVGFCCCCCFLFFVVACCCYFLGIKNLWSEN